MKRKLLVLIFVVITCIVCVFGITACKEDKPDNNGDGQGTIQTPPEEKPSDTENPSVVEVSGVTLNKTTLALEVGCRETLIATITPGNATDKTVIWQSSDNTVAMVGNGQVTALKAGRATITATAGGKSANCKVTVTEKVVAVTSVTLNKTTLALEVDGVETLTVTVLPSNATDKTITWKSSDSTIAKVENGKVTALKVGTATITATCSNINASCKINVERYISSLRFSQSDYYICVGQTIMRPILYYLPMDATDFTATSEIEDETIAKLEGDKLVALAPGSTTYTVTTVNGVTASCTIHCLDFSFEFPSTPFELDNWSNPAYWVTQTAKIENISYTLDVYYSSSNDTCSLALKFQIKGTKTYCYTSGSYKFKINYKIYSEGNTVIDSGTLTSASCAVNEGFVIDKTIQLNNLKEGNYRIELSAVAW